MTVRAQFFDSVAGDRIYNAADFSVHLAGIYSDGYIQDNDTDGLKVTQSSPLAKSVTVSPGKAFIQGRFLEVFSSVETLTVPDNALGATRLDAVFVRIDFVNRVGSLVYKTGTTVSRPTFVRDSTMWELQIANVDAPNAFTQIVQNDITDRRNDLFLCGKSKPTTLRQNFQNTGISGWRRIAVTNGFFRSTEAQRFNVAFANFMIRSQNSSLGQHDHLSITVAALNGVPVLYLNSRARNDLGRNFDAVRLVFDPTQIDERIALEVFVTSTTALCTYEINHNYSENGWFPLNWTAGSVPGGFSECKLDFTIDDLVTGFATSETILNAFGVTRLGTVIAKSDVRLENNESILGKEVGGTTRELIKMNAADQVQVGNTTNKTNHPNDLLLSVNNKFIQATEIDGLTVRSILGLNNLNNVAVGTTARTLFLLGLGAAPQFFDGVNIFNVFHSGFVQPQARVFHNANQSIANNTATALAFNSERWDTNVIHDNVTNNSRLTAKTKGLYHIEANIEWDANATGIRQIFFRVNGATVIAAQRHSAASAGTTQMNISTDYQLAVNDYVETIVLQTSGVALNVLVNAQFSPEFSISFISPTP